MKDEGGLFYAQDSPASAVAVGPTQEELRLRREAIVVAPKGKAQPKAASGIRPLVKSLKVEVKDSSPLKEDPMLVYRWMVLMWNGKHGDPKKRFKLNKAEMNRIFAVLKAKGLIQVTQVSAILFNRTKVKVLDTELKRQVLAEYQPKVILDDYKAVHETYVDTLVRMVDEFSPVDLPTLGASLKKQPKQLLPVAEILAAENIIELKHKDVNSVLMRIDREASAGEWKSMAQAGREVETYAVNAAGSSIKVVLTERMGEFNYKLCYPTFLKPTQAVLDSVYDKATPNIEGEVNTMEDFENVKRRLRSYMGDALKANFPGTDDDTFNIMLAELTNDLHLGRLEYLLKDPNIEEIKAENDSPVFIKHIKCKQDWMETNIVLSRDSLNRYAKAIARETKQQVDSSHPMMDAVLHTGDRVNVSLPETTGGSIIIEIRVFSKKPWNFVRLIRKGTVSAEVMAFLWRAMQNKFNILVSGETGSGKTSFVNALLLFLPKNDHIVSVEDTREIQLPEFYRNWSHMTTKKGDKATEITMSMLLVNSLRMNPSFIIMGEVRGKADIETLMRATAMGHPVVSTIHTRDCSTTIKRFMDADVKPHDLVNIHLNVILEAVKTKEDPLQAKRRVKEVGEYIVAGGSVEPHRIFRLDMNTDTINMINPPLNYQQRIMEKVNMTKDEIARDLAEKKRVIEWLVREEADDIEALGRVIQLYYYSPKAVLAAAEGSMTVGELIERQV